MKDSPPCARCTGVCCTTQAGWRFVTLTKREQKLPLFQGQLAVHPPTGLKGFWFLQSGRCPYLGPQGRCSIYQNRPFNCRNFDCRKPGVGRFLELNPLVKSLILSEMAPV